MSVQAVNSVNNIQQKPVQSPIEPKKSEQKESIANGTTLLLGSLAALAVGAGIYFATKGRGGKSVTSGTSSVTDEQKPLEILKEYTLDAFKKAGHRFEKNIARTSDGKNYTGTITHNTQDGKLIIRKYKNGIIDYTEVSKDKKLIYKGNYSERTVYKDGNKYITKKGILSYDQTLEVWEDGKIVKTCCNNQNGSNYDLDMFEHYEDIFDEIRIGAIIDFNL